VDPRDERPHRPDSPGPELCDTWSFDFWLPDVALAGIVELTWFPAAGRAVYAACIGGPAQPYVLVATESVPMEVPSGALEFRHEEIWAQHVCETPLDHWTVGLEAYGVALDDPYDAFERPWGERTGLGYDVEWEAAGPAEELAPGSYRQPCVVSGEVLVGHDEHPAAAGWGWRRHRWGPWVEPATGWTAFWSSDGSAPLSAPPAVDLAASVIARAPIAAAMPSGGVWREERSFVATGTATGWIGRPRPAISRAASRSRR
jgi:hypothetical protein